MMRNDTCLSLTALGWCFSILAGIFLFLGGCDSGDKKNVQAAPVVPVTAAEVLQMDIPIYDEVAGRTEAQFNVEIRARVEGFLLERRFTEGSPVKKGDLLYVIDPKPFEETIAKAEAELRRNSATLKKARNDEERYLVLYKKNSVSKNEYEKYKTASVEAKAMVDASRADLETAKTNLGYTKIYSPITGRIGRTRVSVGSLVGRGESTVLATVTSVDPMYVSFSISEASYVGYQRWIQSMKKEDTEQSLSRERSLELILIDGLPYSHTGTLDMIDDVIDPTTSTLGVRAKFPNPDGMLRAGQFIRVRFLVSYLKGALLIPQRAVMNIQGRKTVYVVDKGNVATSREVKLGAETGRFFIVESGLQPNDVIVVEGINKIRTGSQVKPDMVVLTYDESPKTPAPWVDADDSSAKTEQ